MKQVSVINLDDPAGKTVGRRRRPINPLATADGLQEFINEQFKESGHRLLYRMKEKTHREKDRADLQFLRENYAEEIFGRGDQV